MSIWNPFAFTPTGQAMAPVAPPALRVIDGQATAQQLAHAQDAFYRFCASARLSAVPNPTEIGALPDGTRYRIVVVGPQTIMEIWPGKAAAPTRGGIVVFYAGVGFHRVWWRDGAWSSKAIARAFCGVNVQRTAEGKYFCDSVATTFTTDSSTFLEGLVRSNPYPLTDGVSTSQDGYLAEYMEKGDINFAIAQQQELVYLSASGNTYQIASTGPIQPAGAPMQLEGAAVTGTLDGGDGVVPQLARRTFEDFLLTTISNETLPQPPSGVVKLRELARGAAPSVSYMLPGPPKKEANIFSVSAAPPHNVSLSRVPLISESSYTAVAEARRKPTVNTRLGEYIDHIYIGVPPPSPPTIYQNFPVEFDFVVRVGYSRTDGYTKKFELDASETQWIRECVNYAGERYSALLRVTAEVSNIIEYTSERPRDSVGTGIPTGSWQLYGIEVPGWALGSPPTTFETNAIGVPNFSLSEWVGIETTVRVMTDKINTSFVVGREDIEVLGIDLTLEASTTVRNPSVSSPPTIVQLDQIQGVATLCKIIGYEEKAYVAVLSEDKYKDFEVTRLSSGALASTFGITATKESSLSVYFGGRKVWTLPKGSSPFAYTLVANEIHMTVPSEHLGATTFEVENYVPQVYTAQSVEPHILRAHLSKVTAPASPQAMRYGGTNREEVSNLAGGSYILDYEELQRDIATPAVRFAVDPTSGGCLVVSEGMNILISPSGTVSQLASTTQLPDGQLDPWCASI